MLATGLYRQDQFSNFDIEAALFCAALENDQSLNSECHGGIIDNKERRLSCT